MIRFLVSVPDGLHHDLKKAAKRRGQTLSGLVREILWDWMKGQPPSATVSNAPAHAEQLLEKLNRGQSAINEARHDLGLAPVEGGDMRLIKRD